MIGKLISLVVFLVIGWVIYVTVFGNKEDIELRNKLFGTAKELGKDVSGIFSHEKEKYDAGEYNTAIDKIGKAISALKQINSSDKTTTKTSYQTRLETLETEKKRLETLASAGADSKDLQDAMKKLNEDIAALANEMAAAK